MGYGFETDFLPPCSPDDPAFKALRASTVQLILPGPLLYPDLPEALRHVLACAGGHVAAVSSFDEPLGNEVSFSEVTQLYEQVKMVAQAGNSEMIIWWGQAALQNTEQAPWPDILHLIAE